jgi:hypothetical protein
MKQAVATIPDTKSVNPAHQCDAAPVLIPAALLAVQGR